MNSRPWPADDPRLEQAALFYAGALSAADAAQFDEVLRTADADFRAACFRLESVAVGLVESVPAVTAPSAIRGKLLQVLALPVLKADSQELERLGIFIRLQKDQDWQDHRIPGIRIRYLHVDHEQRTQTVLMRCAPGAKFPRHTHRGAEDSLVLEGDLRIGDLVLGPGDYQHCKPGSRHLEQSTESGCLVLVRSSID